MRSVVVAEPYRFVAPRRGTLVPRLLQWWLPRHLRMSHGVVGVVCRGIERLRSSIAAGHGIRPPVRPDRRICKVVTLRSANWRRMSLACAS